MLALTLGHEKVKHGEDHGVATEHVVSTRVDASQSHAKTTPDGQRPLYLAPGIAVHLGKQ